jgi:hypothetical protein
MDDMDVGGIGKQPWVKKEINVPGGRSNGKCVRARTAHPASYSMGRRSVASGESEGKSPPPSVRRPRAKDLSGGRDVHGRR